LGEAASTFTAKATGLFKGKNIKHFINDVGGAISGYNKPNKNLSQGMQSIRNAIVEPTPENARKAAEGLLTSMRTGEMDTKTIKGLVEQLSSANFIPKEFKAVLDNPDLIAKASQEVSDPAVIKQIINMVDDDTVKTGVKAIREMAAKLDVAGFKKIVKNWIGSTKESILKANTPEELSNALSFLPEGFRKHVIQRPKEKIVKMVDNWEKISDNLPAGELNKILNEIKENPVKLFDMYVNKDLIKTLTCPASIPLSMLGGGLTAASTLGGLATTWLLQSYFADLEKQAGRVGTMKAIQSLEDPRHFIDVSYQGNVGNTAAQEQKSGSENLSQKLQRLMKIRNVAA